MQVYNFCVTKPTLVPLNQIKPKSECWSFYDQLSFTVMEPFDLRVNFIHPPVCWWMTRQPAVAVHAYGQARQAAFSLRRCSGHETV